MINGRGVGVLDEDLAFAAQQALSTPPERCRAYALEHSWEACAQQFFGNLHPLGREGLRF